MGHGTGYRERIMIKGRTVLVLGASAISVGSCAAIVNGATTSGKVASVGTPQPHDVAAGATAAPAAATAAPKADPRVGQEVTLGDGSKYTVYALVPWTSTNMFEKPAAGTHFLTADVQECAGSTSGDANPYNWSLQANDNTRVQPYLGSREPALHSVTIGPGQCDRGWVTFEVVNSATIVKVVTDQGDGIRWTAAP